MGNRPLTLPLRSAVFLDRDGVINQPLLRDGKPYPPKGIEDLEILPGVALALEQLRQNAKVLIVVTNQPDVARGRQTREKVEEIHQKMISSLAIDDIQVCYHDDQDQCACRKPQPGLILSAAQKFRINLSTSVMIGDRWKDIEAGRRAGCRTIWIDWGYAEPVPEPPADLTTRSLMDAVPWILSLTDQREKA